MSTKSSILRSTLFVTATTLLIKFLGLIKQSVLAAYCGATDETDAFFIASGVLVSLSMMIFSAISITLLSVHTNILINKGRDAANDLINSAIRIFIPLSLGISILFFIASPIIAKILAPAYEGVQLQDLSCYIRWMSCVFVLWCYYLIINVILETDKEFIPGRCQALFQNLFLIIAAVCFFKTDGIRSLLIAFILSGIAECVLVTWCARRKIKLLFHKLTTPRNEISNLFKLAVPLIVGNALYEINDIVDKQVSSFLGSGNVSYLAYGSTINDIVTGVIVMSVSTVLFSHFATWVAEGNFEKVQHNLRLSNELLTFAILPFMSLCIFAGKDILTILYSRGNFGETEITHTNFVVIGYALGFVFSSLRANIVKVYYAFNDTRLPLINGAIAITINICCSITLSQFIGIGGVALSTSIAMLISVILLNKNLKRHLPNYSFKTNLNEYTKLTISFLICSTVLFLFQNNIELNIYGKFIIECIICAATYIFFLLFTKSECLFYIIRKLRYKF